MEGERDGNFMTSFLLPFGISSCLSPTVLDAHKDALLSFPPNFWDILYEKVMDGK